MEADSDEMVRLLGETFAQRDPLAVAAGLTPWEFEELVRLYCPKAAVEGLTIVARWAETAEMIGVLLAEEATTKPPEGIDRLSPKFEPVFESRDRLPAADWADFGPPDSGDQFRPETGGDMPLTTLPEAHLAPTVHSARAGYIGTGLVDYPSRL